MRRDVAADTAGGEVSDRLKQSSLAAGTITLKLKTADFRVRTRSRRVADATQLADTLYHTVARLLAAEATGFMRFRLIGVRAEALVDARAADPPTLFDAPRQLEQAIDQIRDRLDDGALQYGRAPLRPD
jgi:DNA polymerase IV